MLPYPAPMTSRSSEAIQLGRFFVFLGIPGATVLAWYGWILVAVGVTNTVDNSTFSLILMSLGFASVLGLIGLCKAVLAPSNGILDITCRLAGFAAYGAAVVPWFNLDHLPPINLLDRRFWEFQLCLWPFFGAFATILMLLPSGRSSLPRPVSRRAQ